MTGGQVLQRATGLAFQMRHRADYERRRRRWKPLIPPGRSVRELSPALAGQAPERAGRLGALLGLTPDEVVSRLGFTGPVETVTVRGWPVRVRPGTADVFTIEDTFADGYHRSLRELPAEPLIVDLGSNIGLTLLDYGLDHPGATLLGVELDGDNAALAAANSESVGATVVQAAVAAEPGVVRYGGGQPNAYAVSSEGDREAPAITIAELVDRLGGRPIDLLKVDIEGAEREVLERGEEWAPMVRHVLVETHPPYTRAECLDALRRLGFDARLDERHWAGVSGVRAS